jgi:hypothetical protein
MANVFEEKCSVQEEKKQGGDKSIVQPPVRLLAAISMLGRSSIVRGRGSIMRCGGVLVVYCSMGGANLENTKACNGGNPYKETERCSPNSVFAREFRGIGT